MSPSPLMEAQQPILDPMKVAMLANAAGMVPPGSKYPVDPYFSRESLYDALSGAAALKAIQDIRQRAHELKAASAKSGPTRLYVGCYI